MRNFVASLKVTLEFVFWAIVVLFMPPAIVMLLPAYKLWQVQNKNDAAIFKKYYYFALLTAFLPGLGAFWGLEVFYISLLQKILAILHFSLPFLAADGDSFEYFNSSAQAAAFVCLYIALLVPTYSVLALFHFNKAKVVHS